MSLTIPLDVLGLRLRAARVAADLTQDKAAVRLDIARTTLLAIEAGKRSVNLDEIRAFAELYGVREGELLSGERQPLDLEAKFRSSGEKSGGRVAADKSTSSRLLNRLASASLEIESLLGHVIPHADYPIWHLHPEQSIEEQAEDAALVFRQRLGVGMGPLPNLGPLLELEFGFRIFERVLPSAISGACSFHKEYGAFILVNSNHVPERRRQTVGHEAAHGMVRPNEPAIILDTDTFLQREDRFCDAFSRALLLPAVAVRRKAAEVKGLSKLTIRHVLWLAGYFQVSMEAMCRRMESLRLITQGTYDSLKDRGLTRHHLEEVLRDSDLDVPPKAFTPRLLFLASEAYSQGLLSEQQIAEKLELDLASVRLALEGVPASD